MYEHPNVARIVQGYERFAAAAPVAGVTEVADCHPDRPVPVVAFHGTDDGFLAYEGGFGPKVASLPSPDGRGTLGDAVGQADGPEGSTGPSVPEVMAGWAERNGCDDAAPEEEGRDEEDGAGRHGVPASGHRPGVVSPHPNAVAAVTRNPTKRAAACDRPDTAVLR